jgi:hypothetical protein
LKKLIDTAQTAPDTVILAAEAASWSRVHLFLWRLESGHRAPNSTAYTLLLWDRAPWHRGQAIQQILTAHPQLEIVYLPPGAPDLNPQEHVWKAARGAVSHNHRYAKLAQLADAFEHHLVSSVLPCSLLADHAYLQLCARFI